MFRAIFLKVSGVTLQNDLRPLRLHLVPAASLPWLMQLMRLAVPMYHRAWTRESHWPRLVEIPAAPRSFDFAVNA